MSWFKNRVVELPKQTAELEVMIGKYLVNSGWRPVISPTRLANELSRMKEEPRDDDGVMLIFIHEKGKRIGLNINGSVCFTWGSIKECFSSLTRWIDRQFGPSGEVLRTSGEKGDFKNAYLKMMEDPIQGLLMMAEVHFTEGGQAKLVAVPYVAETDENQSELEPLPPQNNWEDVNWPEKDPKFAALVDLADEIGIQQKIVMGGAVKALGMLKKATFNGVTDLEFRQAGVYDYLEHLATLRSRGWEIKTYSINGKKSQITLYLLGPSKTRLDNIKSYADSHDYELI